MGQGKVTVEGAGKVAKAFDKVSSDLENVSDAGAEVAEKLIGDVRQRTRRKTGDLAAAWIGDGVPTGTAFSNPQSYALAQEFGTNEVTATRAVQAAYEENKDAIIGAYSDAIERRAKRANIETAH